MCTQGMYWGFLYILQGIKLRTFEELATRAHDMELSIARRGTKDFPVPEVRKDKKETKSAKKIVKSIVKESMFVNTTSMKFSKRKEGRVEKKDDGSERRRLTLKERHEKVYPFPDSDIDDMLEQLLEKQLIQLPESREKKIELDLEDVAQTNHATTMIMSEAFLPRLIFEQRESLVQFETFEPVGVQFHQEVAPEDSQEKERLIEEDDEEWTVVTRRKNRKSTPIRKEPRFYRNYRRGNKAQKNKKKKKTRKLKLVNKEDKDFRRTQRLVTLADFFPTRFLCDHQNENPGVVACHAINATEEESILRSLEEEECQKTYRAASSSSAPTATYESTPYCMSIDFSDEDLLLGSKLHNRPLYVSGYVREQRVDRILVDNGSAVNIMSKSTEAIRHLNGGTLK
ncbi:ty3-gypsy retrotransposon protein [Cucumis melo var. makuwa]|uniref:Ty3-gypsy retrotransposon protein n=1 Tax=Cucumis melo var. makuwa TaxID=1194695 RepID=A0A5D3DF89_CUCMM|nr:ty3-gypsy retrotransposon protein [Cucumis melo var. makuwa]TYK22203.1 ty3-gypsy retrotransposon protein [Cucumis melo var. makuwa]